MCFMCFIVNKRVVLIYLDCEQSVNDYLQSDEKKSSYSNEGTKNNNLELAETE